MQPYPNEEDMTYVNQCLADGKPDEACKYLRFWGEVNYNELADKIERQEVLKLNAQLSAIRQERRNAKALHKAKLAMMSLEMRQSPLEIITDQTTDDRTIDHLINTLNTSLKESK